jgi:hypothetical protein
MPRYLEALTVFWLADQNGARGTLTVSPAVRLWALTPYISYSWLSKSWLREGQFVWLLCQRDSAIEQIVQR